MAIWEGCSEAHVLRDVTLRSLGKGPMTVDEICRENILSGQHPYASNVLRILDFLVDADVVRSVPPEGTRYELVDRRYAIPTPLDVMPVFNDFPESVRRALIGEPPVTLLYPAEFDED